MVCALLQGMVVYGVGGSGVVPGDGVESGENRLPQVAVKIFESTTPALNVARRPPLGQACDARPSSRRRSELTVLCRLLDSPVGGDVMMEPMMIGQLAERTGLTVRTLRFYADAGVLPEAGRSASGYRLFGPDAVARARLVRTLRELGVGLEDIKRVLDADMSLAEVAAEHARALDAQIRLLRMQQAVLRAFVRSNDLEELHAMTDLTALTAEERRRIVEDYLDAVFGANRGAVADALSKGAPELPEEPTPEQVAAWVELAQLLQDPDFVATSRRMAEHALADGPAPDPGQFEVSTAVGKIAGPAARAGVDPASTEALAIIERIEAVGPTRGPLRRRAADRGVHRSAGRPLLDARRHRQRLGTRPSPRRRRGDLGVVQPRAASARIAPAHSTWLVTPRSPIHTLPPPPRPLVGRAPRAGVHAPDQRFRVSRLVGGAGFSGGFLGA